VTDRQRRVLEFLEENPEPATATVVGIQVFHDGRHPGGRPDASARNTLLSCQRRGWAIAFGFGLDRTGKWIITGDGRQALIREMGG
jgi:hypothetical protein